MFTKSRRSEYLMPQQLKILPEKYQVLERTTLGHFKTRPNKRWGFFKSFFNDARGYHVRKPYLGNENQKPLRRSFLTEIWFILP